MRVLQVVTTRRSFFDQQVAALERAGVDCETVTVPRSGSGGRGPLDFLRFLRTVRRKARAGFDLVHANCGVVAPLAFAQPVRPVVVTFWGSDLMGDETPSERLVRRASRWAARRAAAVVLPSRAMAAHLDREYALVPFGVDPDRFRAIPRPFARERVGWDPEERIVLFPYDPDRPEKDHDRARAVVERAGVDATLRTVTGVPHEEMPAYLNASDALLVTSRRESGPMVVKEAVACGLPVVSTDVGFVREVLDGVPTGAVRDSTPGLAAALEAALAPASGETTGDGRREPRLGDGRREPRLGDGRHEPRADDGRGSVAADRPWATTDGGRAGQSAARPPGPGRSTVTSPDDTAARLVQVYERVLAADRDGSGGDATDSAVGHDTPEETRR